MSPIAETIAVLCDARALYAASPSHAPSFQSPTPGTYCPIYALGVSVPFAADWPAGAEMALVRAAGTDRIPTWNAEHTTEEVLAAFDRAIADQCALLAEHLGVTASAPMPELVVA